MNRAWVLGVGLAVALTGCVGSKADKDKDRGRAQKPEDTPADAGAVATVGQKTLPENMAPVAVSGVGLVYRLQPGAGSSPPPGTWRQMLEHALKKQKFDNVKQLLDDPNRTTSLVLVSAFIPPGARKGEPLDLHITLPEDSKTTSLKGGVLLACDLVDYDTTGNLKALAQTGRGTAPSGALLLGNKWATGEGPVVAGTTADAKPAPRAEDLPDGLPPEALSLKVGRVWGGGKVVQPRPYYFLMQPGDKNYRMVSTVAERLNSTFQMTADPTSKVAEAKTNELVVVTVPRAYRHNHLRFLLVARQVPVAPVPADGEYRRRLEDQLHDPATAIVAAVKLEALGGDSRQALRVALNNASPWVRFAAAESLAYLGHTDGAAELAKLAADHPALRAHCLKALAAGDDAAFTDRLADLLASPDPALRYGAFLALRLADENNSAVAGKLFNASFWVHQAAPGSPGLVHLTADRRSEVVVFGDGVKLRGPFTRQFGTDYVVAVTDATVKVSRIVRVKGEPEVKDVTCPTDLVAVLAALAKLGGGYSEAVELLRRAEEAQALTAAVVVDAVPRQMAVQQLAALAAKDPAMVKADVEVARLGTVGADPEAAGVDFADPEADAKADAAPAKPPLSHSPGRIFGPKRAPEPAVAEPLPPVVPVEATAPPEPAAEKPADLGRSPGRLFGKK